MKAEGQLQDLRSSYFSDTNGTNFTKIEGKIRVICAIRVKNA